MVTVVDSAALTAPQVPELPRGAMGGPSIAQVAAGVEVGQAVPEGGPAPMNHALDFLSAADDTARRLASGRPVNWRQAAIGVGGIAITTALVTLILGWIPAVGPLLSVVVSSILVVLVSAGLIKLGSFVK